MRTLAGMGTVAGHAVAGLRMNRGRTLTAVLGLAAGVAVLTAVWHAGSLDGGDRVTGPLLLAVVAGATAAAVDPRQLRAAAVLDLSGATRTQRRAVVVVEAAVLGLLAFPLGWLAGVGWTTAAGTRRPDVAIVGLFAVLVPTVVALFAGRMRTRVTAVDARGAAPPAPRPPVVRGTRGLLATGTALRLLTGFGLIWMGYWLASSTSSFFDLDLFLWPGIALAGGGLGLLLPFLVHATAAALDRLPWLTPNLDAALLRSRRKLLAPALLLGTVAALAVAVNGVLGAGLTEREQRRRQHLDQFEFTAGLHPDDVIVGRAQTGSLFEEALWSISEEDGDPGPYRLAAEAAERVRSAYPDAAVTTVEFLPAATVGADPQVPGPGQRWVAAGTPELLAALDLDRYAADLDAGRAVALDPTVLREGRATIDVYDYLSDRTPTVSGTVVVDAVAADLASIPLHLPALLVPPGLDVPEVVDLAPAPPLGPHALLVRLTHRATAVDAAAIAELVRPGSEPLATTYDDNGMRAWPGGERLSFPYDEGRLDAAETVTLHDPDEVRAAVLFVALVALVGLFVTLRLATVTRRSDEDVVEALGARPRTLRRLAVLQAAVLAALATSLGLAVGIVLTRAGIATYNSHGRFEGDSELPPIPLVVPPALWVGLVAVPLVAAALAWLLALRRPAPTPAALADGLLW